MKNKKITLSLIVACCIFIIPKVYAGWPLNRTPAIEGHITDAVTGKPVENVILECEWAKEVISIEISGYGPAAMMYIITDKNGYYKIPAKTTFHIFSGFKWFKVRLIHPLYDIMRFGMHNLEKGEIKTEIDRKYRYGFSIRDNNGYSVNVGTYTIVNKHLIRCDIPLMSLEEKYKKPEDNSKFDTYLSMYENGWYFLTLRKRNIQFNIDYILLEWRRLVNRFPKEKHYENLKWRYEKTESKIKEVIKNDK